MSPLLSTFMLSGPSHQDSTLFFVRRFSRAKFDLLLNDPVSLIHDVFLSTSFRLPLHDVSFSSPHPDHTPVPQNHPAPWGPTFSETILSCPPHPPPPTTLPATTIPPTTPPLTQ